MNPFQSIKIGSKSNKIINKIGVKYETQLAFILLDDLFLFKRGTLYPFSSENMEVLAIEDVQILFR
jgi:hypothetical protein